MYGSRNSNIYIIPRLALRWAINNTQTAGGKASTKSCL